MKKNKSKNILKEKSVYETIKINKKKLNITNIDTNKSVQLLKENSFSNLYQNSNLYYNSNLKKTKRLENVLKKGYFNINKENVIIDELKRKSFNVNKEKKKVSSSLKLSQIAVKAKKNATIEENSQIAEIAHPNEKFFIGDKQQKTRHFRKISENNINNIYLNENSLKSASLDSQNFLILKYNCNVQDKSMVLDLKETDKKVLKNKVKKKTLKKKSLPKKNWNIKNCSIQKNCILKIQELKKSFNKQLLKRYSQNRKSLNKLKLVLRQNKNQDQVNKSTNFYTGRKKSTKINVLKKSAKLIPSKKIESQVESKIKKKNKSVSIAGKRSLFISNINPPPKLLKKVNTKISLKSPEYKEPFININFEKTKNIYFNLTSKKKVEQKTFFEELKSIQTNNNIIFSSAGTNVGSIRKSNEDRISLLLNLNYKKNSIYNFYGIYDGHAGAECSEYLKNNLHKKFIDQKDLFDSYKKFKKISKEIFQQTDNDFLKISEMNSIKSGSCATIMMFYNNDLYLVNTGDSRAIMSLNGGKSFQALTEDHKPEVENEKKRIFENGGYLYTSSTHLIKNNEEKVLQGPVRVFPGRLTISRAFGDINAKNENFGGKNGVLVVEPDCYKYSMENTDFVVIGSDGLFESLTNEDVVQFVWGIFQNVLSKGKSINKEICEFVVQELIRFCMHKGSLDNISVILVVFEKIKFFLN